MGLLQAFFSPDYCGLGSRGTLEFFQYFMDVAANRILTNEQTLCNFLIA
jgi:hypothetical protein